MTTSSQFHAAATCGAATSQMYGYDDGHDAAATDFSGAATSQMYGYDDVWKSLHLRHRGAATSQMYGYDDITGAVDAKFRRRGYQPDVWL